jgi:hypothetical protein
MERWCPTQQVLGVFLMEVERKNIMRFRTGIGLWVLALIVGAISLSKSPPAQQNARPAQIDRPPAHLQVKPKPPATENMLINYNWHRGGFDAVMLLNFTVRNQNDFAVKDFTITCDHYSKSGTRIDSNSRTVYEIVPAGIALSKADFNMGFFHSQVSNSKCYVSGLLPA